MGDDVDACLAALNKHTTSNTGEDLHIVERINMSFTVSNAIVNSPNLTKFKIAGELPELQVNFSDRKYQTLMKFIDVAVPRFGDDDDHADAGLPATINPSFVRRQVKEYNLEDSKHEDVEHDDHDKRSIKSHGTQHSIDGGDQFFDPHDDQTETQKMELQQVSFEFNFSVGKLQASLFRSTSATTERLLANAALEGFGLTFKQRKYEMSVDLFLRNIALAMQEHGKTSQRPLLSSGEVSKGDSEGHKLVQVHYLRVQKDSPDYMTKYEAVDQNIDVELSTFNITIAPEPILSLYDFIMTTFVSNDEEQPNPDDAKSEGEADKVPEEQPSADKIRIRVKLTSAQVSLENNDTRFALLSLPSADVGLLLRNNTMRVVTRLGDLSIEDTTNSQPANPAFKKILYIEGEELADFSYETFNPEDSNFPGYNSSIHLRAGSLKFTFMEQPLHDLYVFGIKFARMKAVYDAASQAAVQRASEVSRMKYDIVVKTPIIVLPRDGNESKDALTLRLGEIVAQNNYLGDARDTSTIDASLSGINVTSELFKGDDSANLQLVDDVAITASVKQRAPTSEKDKQGDPHQADTEITTEMSDVKLQLTEGQYVLVMAVLEAVPRALSELDDEDEDSPDTPDTPSELPTPIPEEGSPTPPPDTPSEASAKDGEISLAPELTITSKDDGVSTSLDLVFTVQSIAMEVFSAAAFAAADLQKHSIAKISLIGSHLALKTLSNSAMEAEFSLKTLAFSSTRAGNSAFRDIVPELANDGNQL